MLFAPSKDNENKPIPESTWRKFMKEAFPNKNIGFDILRSSYAIHTASMKLNYNEREKTARAMRHSQNTSQRDYQKMIGLEELIPQEQMPIIESPKPKKINVEKTTKTQFDQREYMNKYRANPEKQEIIKKAKKKYNELHKEQILRSKILRYVNQYADAYPTQKSIDQYKLVQKDGIWI